MKKILIVFAAIILGLTVVIQVNAETGKERLNTTIKKAESKIENKPTTRTAENQSQRLERIKKQAGRLIDNRIENLNKLLTRVDNDSRLSDIDKTALKSSIQSTIDGLSTLRAKIDTDTDIETAKTDAKTIITSYYIYRMFEPKIRLTLAVNNLQALSAKLSITSTTLQGLINNLKEEGKNTTSIQILLDDVNSQLSTINTVLASDKTKLDALNTGSDFTATLTSVRNDLQTVKNNFQKIRNDISQIRTGFREIRKSSNPSPAK